VFFRSEFTDATPVHAGKTSPEAALWRSCDPQNPWMNTERTGQVRLTADLNANTVRVVIQYVPKAVAGAAECDEPAVPLYWVEDRSWTFRAPDLALCHLHVAGGKSLRLTLLP
jgi:hypothetical protein